MKKFIKVFSEALVLLLVAGLLPGLSLTAYARGGDVYKVTVSDCQNGTVTATPASGVEGTSVTVTAVPDGGFVTSEVKAYKSSAGTQRMQLTGLYSNTQNPSNVLVDENINTKWGCNPVGSAVVKANKAFLLTGYSLTTADDTATHSGRNWKDWEIYGANFASDSEAVIDSAQWRLVTSVTNDTQLAAVNFTTYNYTVSSAPGEYKYYKITLTANKGAGDVSQMAELSMRGISYDTEFALIQDSTDETKYTFDIPASNVIVKAVFAAIPTYEASTLPRATTRPTKNPNDFHL